MIYRKWPEFLPPAVEVCPVELPGRGARMDETAFTSVAPLIEAAAQALLPYFDRPFAFFGHSMGAIISFELTRYLAAKNLPQPVHLFLSGRRAPQLMVDAAPTYNLPEPEFVEELRRLDGTPEEVLAHPELMQLLIPLLRADFALCQTYISEPGPPVRCPITTFGSLEDSSVSRSQLEGWQEQTTAAFSLQMFPGNHFFLLSAQRDVLRILTKKLYQFKAIY